MTEWNIAKRSPEEQEKTATDLLAAGVAYRLRMKQPVIPEQEMRQLPEHLRTIMNGIKKSCTTDRSRN